MKSQSQKFWMGAVLAIGGGWFVTSLLIAGLSPAHAMEVADVAEDTSPIWDVLLDSAVVIGFFASMFIWASTALRSARRKHASREFFVTSALNNLSQGIVMLDANRHIAYCNDRFLEIYGLSRSELRKNMTGLDLFQMWAGRSSLQCGLEEFRTKAIAPEGYIFHVQDGRFIRVQNRHLANGGFVSIHEDVTAQNRLSDELASTKKFLETVVDHIPSSVEVKCLNSGRFVLANRAAKTIFNRASDGAVDHAMEELHPQDALQRDQAAVRKGGLVTEEHAIPTANGLRLFATRRVTVNGDDGKPRYLIKTSEDITLQRETETRTAHMAYHDALTGMLNRVAFLRTLDQLIDACGETEEEFAVLSMDLDGFKDINGAFGHEIGDKLLIEIARRIDAIAGTSVVARLGGDEYGLIIDGEQPASARHLAQLVSDAIARDFIIDGKTLRVGVTMGVSTFPKNGRDGASLLANADAALSRAKNKARGSVSFYDAAMDEQIRNHRALHRDLLNALRGGELSLHYQPQARARHDLTGDDVMGFEALVRWNHPTRGLVPPGEFIPIAEESGAIVEIGAWILREACREAASWPRHLKIAVNLSPAQFMHGDVVGLVHSTLLETGLTPGRLELEITEGVLIEDFDRGLSLLRRLKALGIHIAMDDFGSGYSSLTYLQAFPFDTIKIDRTFVMNLGRNEQSAAIIRAVIGLGHGLGISIVAEGVETQDQLSFLAVEGCDQVQGYLLGKPAKIEAYDAWVGRVPAAQMLDVAGRSERARKAG